MMLAFVASGILLQTPTCGQQPTTTSTGDAAPASSESTGSQAKTEPAPATEASQAIDAGLAEVATNEELDATAKSALQQLFQQAKENLQAAAVSEKNATEFQQQVVDAESNASQIKEKLNQPKSPPSRLSSEDQIDTIKQRLAQAKIELTEATNQAAELATEPSRRQKRLAEIPSQLSQTEKQLEEIAEQMARPAPSNEKPIETRARTALLTARRAAIDARVKELQAEQAAYVATADLLPLRKGLADQNVKTLSDEVGHLQQVMIQIQESAASDTTQALRHDLSQVDESLKELAQKNVTLSERHQKLVSETAKAAATLNDIQKSYETVKADLTVSKERVAAVGLTDALGLMLRNQRLEYEEVQSKYQPRDDLRNKIQEYQIEAFELEDESDEISARIAAMESRDDELNVAVKAENSEPTTELALLKKRQELINDTLQTQNGLLQSMLLSDTQRRELRLAIDEYTDFVDKQVFWIRSSTAFSPEEFKYLPAAVAWLISPQNWAGVGTGIVNGFVKRPVFSLLGLLGVVGLFVALPRLRRYVRGEGELASRYNATYQSTVGTLCATILVASAWPSVFAVLGWMLLESTIGDHFALGVGNGLAIMALFIASRRLLMEVCRNDGLADAHFGWHAAVRKMLRFHLRWYTVVGAALIFLMMVLHEHPDTPLRAMSARLTTTSLFLLIALFHHIVFRVRSPLYVQIASYHPESKIYKLRRLVWLILVGLPMTFAVMSLAGYLDTAFHLGKMLQTSILLLVLMLLVVGLMFRWLTLHYRDSAIRQAREKREKKLAAMKLTESESLPADVGIELVEEESADLPTLDRQTRHMVTTVATALSILALAYIWSDVLPALEILDKVKFIDVGVGDSIESVTLKDVIYMVAVIVATVFAVRNLPGLLELVVLRRAPLDSGARYALTTLFRYALTVFGTFIVLNLLSVPYSQLGWLLAAASVGLGFGLQEIVANFVSGIILLLERPVRVGDVVTIDGTTGVVSRIQMRATTVTSWDRKELVVPNKDLITEKLLNWSLSNVINRLTINVGVDYSADPDNVREILRRVVAAHPEVMDDPPPLINLDEFGDNSLNFAIRFFLANLERRIAVTHEINAAIVRALRDANINIPFPQRDLHLRVEPNQEGLPITLQHSDTEPK